MQKSFQRIITGTIFFVTTLVVAVVGYTMFGWTLLDSVYMVVITIFGVGYGEVEPLETPAEKIFTILVIIAGTSSAVYIVGGFVQMLAEGEINRALDARRKSQGIESLEKHTIICGFGRIGQILARQLQEVRQNFVVVDHDGDRVASAEALGYLAQHGSATDEDILEFVGIKKAKVLATVLPDDAVNVFITLTARGMNPNLMILARGELPTTEKKLRLAGADHVVLPAAISAQRITHLISRPAALAFLEQKDERQHLSELLAQVNVQIDELVIAPNSDLVGRTIKQIEVRGKGAFIVIALRRHQATEAHPDQNTILNGGDTVIVMGHQGDIPQFAKTHALKRQMRYRGAQMG